MSTRPDDRAARWIVPVTCVVLGAVFLVIGLSTGQTRYGITALVVMLGYCAALLIFRRRDEPAALLAGDHGDERRERIQLLAAATMGRVLVVVVVAGVVWSVATQNRFEAVFATLAAIGGLTLMTSTVWYSRRT